jgi:beta-galactosidase beta subunit
MIILSELVHEIVLRIIKLTTSRNEKKIFEGHEKAIEIDKQLKNADGASTDKVGNNN